MGGNIMALNKILSSMVEDFCEKNTFRDLSPSKAYEYIVNYSVISKFHPEAFTDPQHIKSVDVDSTDSMFGLDCVAFIINDNLILSKADIADYAKANTLDVKIVFIQTKIEEKYDTGNILKTINAVKSFLGDRTLLSNSDEMKNAFEIYDELCEYKNSRLFNTASPKCYVYYVTAARPCEEQLVNDICEAEKKSILATYRDIKNVELQVLGSDYVTNAYKEVENRIEVCINFKNSLSLDKLDRVEQSYIGYLSGEEFLKIIVDSQGNLRRRLFYENVRDYQGDTPVNAEIRETIASQALRNKFILLNNGITIVTKHFKALGSNEYEMTDFQIVNGCQTSNEIYLQRENSKGILIPVKIIHTTDAELIAMIVKASNRQTMVPDEAFVAMEEYHKTLQDVFESYSKEMPLKLYYERRSGEFDFLEKRPSRFQIITLHSLIRAVTSVYFADAYIVYNNNPVNILRNRKSLFFVKTHIPEIYYISNYLISQFNYMNFKREFEKDEYKIRFYIPMVARMLLVKSVVTPDFSSKKAKDETQKIISIVNENQEGLTQAFKKAVEITEKSIAVFKGENPQMTIDKILRSQKFNQLVKEQTADYLKIDNH